MLTFLRIVLVDYLLSEFTHMTSPEPLESPLLHGLVAAVVYEHIELGPGGPQQDLTEAVHHDGPEQLCVIISSCHQNHSPLPTCLEILEEFF